MAEDGNDGQQIQVHCVCWRENSGAVGQALCGEQRGGDQL